MSPIILPKKLSPVHIQKYRDRHIELPCAGHVGVGGYFRLECVKDDGRSFWLTDWFHNNVTNAGLDMMATDVSRYNCCQVGSGNAAPTNADTTLQTFLAGTSSRSFLGNSYVAGPPAYIQSYIRYDFAINQVVGNISELGVGPATGTGTALFSRELIRDASGNPTTVSVPTNSQVRVHYKIRHYPPMVDVTGVLNGTIYGNSTPKNFTRRAAVISTFSSSPDYRDWAPYHDFTGQATGNFGSAESGGGPLEYGLMLASGSIGSITDLPTEPYNSFYYTASSNSYSYGSYSRSYNVSFSHAEGAASIKSIAFPASSKIRDYRVYEVGCLFQVEFDTAIAKGANDTFAFTANVSWGRYS
ncbi:MAG: hypothetical protein EPN60_05260 [Nevskiaceae bacterium]|nr:MAG: hypothetical protein EPN60_05260 [Nevskiaceae bacterium]